MLVAGSEQGRGRIMRASAAFDSRGRVRAATGAIAMTLWFATMVCASDAPPTKELQERTGLAADRTYALPGLISRDSTLDSLRATFGAQNVGVAQIDGAEGETLRGIVLFAPDPERRADLFVADEGTLSGIMTIRVAGERSRWHLESGLHLGATLDELVAFNGAPIGLSGLGWDYGGAVLDWKQGRLASPEGATVFRSVVLAAPDDAPEGAFPLGDGEFASDDPSYPDAGRLLRVGEIQVSFPAPGTAGDE
jgi:hypothetical protein